MTMCEECREHAVDCAENTIARARPDQLRRLLRDVLNPMRRTPERREGQG